MLELVQIDPRHYNSVIMHIINGLAPGISRLARRTADISRDAQRRVKWFDYYEAHGHNVRLTCRHFGISPETFYRWKRRYNPRRLESLEDRSHRPKHVRQPIASPELVTEVLKLREKYPRWGKDKLVVLLRRQGSHVSTSMVGRILRRLKDRGVLCEPVKNHVSAHRRGFKRPYAVRKPKGYEVTDPGDLVQLDTLDIRPLPGVILKHFTARDILSRWDTLGIYRRATSHTAREFLDNMQERMPFSIKAIQVDGGSEFESVFEEECQKRNIKLFVLPPRSPKLNGCVERAHRTHIEEFYEVTESSFDVPDIRDKLLDWEKICDTVRPNQAINYLTPLEFMDQWNKTKRKEALCL